MNYEKNSADWSMMTRRRFLKLAGAAYASSLLPGCVTLERRSPSAELAIRDQITEAIKKSTADYTDIRFVERRAAGILTDSADAKGGIEGKGYGGITRAYTDGAWGWKEFSSLDELQTSVTDACSKAISRRKPDDPPPVDLPIEERYDEIVRAPMADSYNATTPAQKRELASQYWEALTSSADVYGDIEYHDWFETAYFANSIGSFYLQERPAMTMCATASGPKVGAMMRKRFTTATSFDELKKHLDEVKELGVTTEKLDGGERLEKGVHTIVLEPSLAGVYLAHEGFGHAFEAHGIVHEYYPHLKEVLKFGNRLGPDSVTIVDDGIAPGLATTRRFDDSGIRTQKTVLIKNGIVTNHLHSLVTACEQGARPTGNSVVLDSREFPYPGMTSTYVDRGNATFKELVAGVKDGIYGIGSLGKSFTTRKNFAAWCMYGYRIIDGEVAWDKMVHAFRLNGSMSKTLFAIDGIENADPIANTMLGYCSGGRPVGIGAPHVMVRDVSIQV